MAEDATNQKQQSGGVCDLCASPLEAFAVELSPGEMRVIARNGYGVHVPFGPLAGRVAALIDLAEGNATPWALCLACYQRTRDYTAAGNDGVALCEPVPPMAKEDSADVDSEEAEAQFNLGVCYYYGDQGLNKNHGEAVKWFRKAAAQGFAMAEFSLGVCYRFGLGVERDGKEASIWYQKAAAHGYTELVTIFPFVPAATKVRPGALHAVFGSPWNRGERSQGP